MQALSFKLDRDDLCERLGGGLPAGSLTVIEGPGGAGKSILVQRIIYGLIQNGHSATIVSTEMTTGGFIQQMDSLQYDVMPPILQERLVFLPVHPLLGARAPRHDLLRRVARAQRMYTKEVVAFDCFSKFLSNHVRYAGQNFNSLEQIEAVLFHFKRLNGEGRSIILTLEDGHVPEEFVRIFKESADFYISLKSELLGNTSTRRIVVNRLSRAAGRFGDVIGYRVEPGIGIVVEIKSVV